MQIVIYLLIGFTVGSVSGALGIGGGVLLVPALIWLCRLEPIRAAGTSLAVLALPIAVPAAVRCWQEDRVDLAAVPYVAASFALGGYLGAAWINYLPEQTLRLLFGLALFYIGMRFVLSSSSDAAAALAGLIACTVAWAAYLGLKTLGQKHIPRPDLATQIRRMQEEGHGEIDYYI